jgi:hypothetical protein
MTHTDDQVAKHVKDMILRITREPGESQERPRKPDTTNRIIGMLRRGPDRIHGLIPPRTFPLRNENTPA